MKLAGKLALGAAGLIGALAVGTYLLDRYDFFDDLDDDFGEDDFDDFDDAYSCDDDYADDDWASDEEAEGVSQEEYESVLARMKKAREILGMKD